MHLVRKVKMTLKTPKGDHHFPSFTLLSMWMCTGEKCKVNLSLKSSVHKPYLETWDVTVEKAVLQGQWSTLGSVWVFLAQKINMFQPTDTELIHEEPLLL